jgi:tetratricopeptide (TPR) repeat protein
MFMFAMFADCEGRDQAFADERYEAIWQAHLTWYRDRSAIPESARSIPEILTPVIPDPVVNVPVPPTQDLVRTPPLRPVVAPAPVKPLPPRPVMPPTPPALATVPASFGALQYLINRAIEDCCAHIKGALSHESMREALQELLRLNSNSVPYFYHIGYYQGLSAVKFTIEKQQTQIGQAWAFFGYVMGCHRDNGDAVAGVIERNAPLWQLLLKNIPSADLQVLYTLMPALIAYRAYDDIADVMAHSSVPYLTHAEHPDSVAMVIYQVTADLVRNGTQLPQADRILQLLITQLDDAGLRGNLYGRCLRKRGQYFRRKKQFHQASELFQQAIAMPEFSEIAQTHADIGMALANFPGLDALLPSDIHDFKVIISAIRGQRDHFERGVQSGVGDDTNAQFVLGLLAFGDGDYLMALDSFRMAQIGMERQLSAYKVRDLYDWLLFLKIRTWSQQVQLSEISLFRDELEVVFR